jgi:hypothetical protein
LLNIYLKIITGFVKVKKNKKIIDSDDLWNIEELLEHDNNYVLKYFDEIVNDEERKMKIIEAITYLNDCLLDRDAGNAGPKLIDQLKERVQILQTNVKEYTIEDLIWWKGTEAQLEYLFNKLINENLIESSQYNLRFSLLSKHFKNPEGNRYKNKQLSQAVRNLRGQNAPESEKIDEIVEETGKCK